MYDARSELREFVGANRAEAVSKACSYFSVSEGDLDVFEPPPGEVYGLAARADSDAAVAAIYRAKGRPDFNPLIVHVATVEAARRLVAFDSRAEALAARFWPGPLTMVLPRRPDCGISLLCSAGLDSLAVRLPAHPVARAIIAAQFDLIFAQRDEQ